MLWSHRRTSSQFDPALQSELRTLLKLTPDVSTSQVVHKLREAFHFLDIMERYHINLQRVLQIKDTTTSHEGTLRAVQELIRQNELLKQQVAHQQEIIGKLQGDRRAVLKRFHKAVPDYKVNDFGSGSLLMLANQETSLASRETLSKSEPSVVGHVTTGDAVTRTALCSDRKDLATLLSSRIDHMLYPSANPQKTAPSLVKQLSPGFIRKKQNKAEKKILYKITGVLRPCSQSSSCGSHMEVELQAQSTPLIQKVGKHLPEILARHQTPTPSTATVAHRGDFESATSSRTSVAESCSIQTDSRSSTLTKPRRVRIGSPRKSFKPHRGLQCGGESAETSSTQAAPGNVPKGLTKRYSTCGHSATHPSMPAVPAAPAFIKGQDKSTDDTIDSITDIKKGMESRCISNLAWHS